MPNLEQTFDLLQRHHVANGSSASRRGSPPTTAEWSSLWPALAEIREASASGDTSARDWLAINGGMVRAVEECRRVRWMEAPQFKSGR